MNPPAIEVSHLVKRYNGLTAVDDLSFDVQPGELFGFLGPNGAGKTTTIHILCTLLAPSSGSASVAGFDCLNQPRQVRQSLGIIFQDPSLDERLTAWENLEFHGMIYHMPKLLRRERMEAVLDLVDLGERRHSIVRTYSGGMKRRLEVARGLMHQPRVLFLDEPTIGLDPQTRRRIWDLFKQLRAQLGMTLFLTTHSMEEASQCGRVAIIDRGELLALDSPQALVAAHRAENLEKVFLTLTGHGLRDEEVSGPERMRDQVRRLKRWR
ncbi:MAG: ATP-binding cassette domain-containing protein [Candidatus Omnitrophica bacterium]|nr:ATP-binding cassette domain-containing protein [Candidatus Omnitrophota bacterium]